MKTTQNPETNATLHWGFLPSYMTHLSKAFHLSEGFECVRPSTSEIGDSSGRSELNPPSYRPRAHLSSFSTLHFWYSHLDRGVDQETCQARAPGLSILSLASRVSYLAPIVTFSLVLHRLFSV
jgi:hypothetical protein